MVGMFDIASGAILAEAIGEVKYRVFNTSLGETRLLCASLSREQDLARARELDGLERIR
jgi:hypothetical protein